MHVKPGSRLGPYEVVAPLGAGGMGEVYRARDTRLSREVAIKVLPAVVSSDPDLRRRLDREARAISALSHPNICALFDIGHEDGVDFLVMELLDGETLASRLARGPLPIDQTLRHAAEIADALAAAHRSGIVHRDLKPGNVMLTRTGARLLDFGLAKAATPASPAAAIDATVSGPITAHGTIVGTSQYMSPEQVEGGEVDARSDIFALGAVIHEMATGRRAFEGKTTASTIASILEKDPPPVSTVQPLAPPALDDIVRGCLAKNPDDRWQTAHDVKLQLDAVRRRLESGTAAAADPAAVRRPRLALVPWAIAGIALVVAAFVLARQWTNAPAPMPVVRASLLPPAGHSFTPNDFAISPDGRRIAFTATGADGVTTLWIRTLETSHQEEIAGSDAATSPFWSPDSRWIAFFTRGKLMKVEPGGLGLQPIGEITPTGRSGTWSADGVILFSNAVLGPLMRVAGAGGTPQPVTQIPADTPGEAHRFPQFLPDGQRFLYVASWTNQQRGGLYLGGLDGRPPELVSGEILSRVVLVGSQLLYVRDGILYAQTFNTARGRLTGLPHPVLRNEVIANWRFGEVPLSASSNGILVFQSRHNYNSQLVWYDRTGKELGPVGLPGYAAPELSPDGRRVAVAFDAKGNGQTGIWIYDFERSLPIEISANGNHTGHAWSPDGRWIAYSAQRGTNGIYRRRADGGGGEETLKESAANLIVNSFSGDSRRLLFMDFAEGNPEIVSLNVESGQVEPIDDGAEASYSPDGRWVVYIAYLNGSLVARRVGTDTRVQISSGTGSQARWRADMKEIFYIAPDKKLMSVPLTVRDGMLEPGKPVPLFQTRVLQPRLVLFQYAVTPDGQKFLVNSLPREDAAAPLTLLTNWR